MKLITKALAVGFFLCVGLSTAQDPNSADPKSPDMQKERHPDTLPPKEANQPGTGQATMPTGQHGANHDPDQQQDTGGKSAGKRKKDKGVHQAHGKPDTSTTKQ